MFSVNMATGKVEIKSLSIKRDGVDIMIKSVRVALPSMGRMMVTRDIDTCVVLKATVELSARGALALAKRERVPLAAREFQLRDVTIAVSPTLLFPGLGKMTLRIESAMSRNVEVASATSWLTDLDEMIASADGPLGASGTVSYSGGKLSLGGTWFGSNAISVPFEIPKLDSSLLEVNQLKTIGKSLVKTVAKHVAKDKLFDLASDLFK